MNRKYSIKPDFTIDEVEELNKDAIFVDRRKKKQLAAAPLRLVIPGLSSLRTAPTKE